MTKKSLNIDKILLLTVIIASIYGITAIFSATRSLGTNSNVIVQSASMFIGLVIMLFLTFPYCKG